MRFPVLLLDFLRNISPLKSAFVHGSIGSQFFLPLHSLYLCFFVERVVEVWAAQQRLDTENHGSDLKRRRPLVLEDVETNLTTFADVRVPNGCFFAVNQKKAGLRKLTFGGLIGYSDVSFTEILNQ
jgi:hypothetical protein